MVTQDSHLNLIELGRHLLGVRERAELTQADLAKRIQLSQAVLSRIEAGDRAVTLPEIQDILAAIGTREAAELSNALQRTWRLLPRPPLDHPDQELLWQAEKVAQELADLRDRPNTPAAFERRVSEYIDELKRCAALLLKREHQIALIGSIGVGKSTAICRMTDLLTPRADGTLVPVLEVGGGGITVCEVHLRSGPGYGIIVEPRSNDEIRMDVGDFADHLYRDLDPQSPSADESEGISKEVMRALRNLAGLGVQRTKGSDGKRNTVDPARELAERIPTQREFVVEVLTRMELPRRDRHDIWYESGSGKSPKAWIHDTFRDINNGRHPEFSLPKRVEVVVPTQLLNVPELSVRIIDTKGIDRTAAREDIEMHFNDPHTLAVICSHFNSAPSTEAQTLLKRAMDAAVQGLELNAAVLVLPRATEPLAMKDDASGVPVDTADEGCELKREQIALAFEPLGLQRLAVEFYDAEKASPAAVQTFLRDRLKLVRDAFRARMRTGMSGAGALIQNREKEKVRAVVEDAAGHLRGWIKSSETTAAVRSHVEESLMAQIHAAHASTVRASVRREGEWSNLSYSYQIGYGARRLAVLALGAAVEGFAAICNNMRVQPRFSEAEELITQAQRVLTNSYEDVLRKVQIMGQTVFKDALKADPQFWQLCIEEWGRGPGYKGRVANHNKDWFEAESRQRLETELKALIGREWSQALKILSDLLPPESPGVELAPLRLS